MLFFLVSQCSSFLWHRCWWQEGHAACKKPVSPAPKEDSFLGELEEESW